MGAYLSAPVTEKISSDEIGKWLDYGASSMQGWRVSQEDAHNSIIDFDENTHIFAVYDGHGGHEVAAYTALKLPEFIKSSDAYKTDSLPECLKKAFLSFDATLVKPEVVNILKQIAGTKDDDDDDAAESEEEEEMDNLYKEAVMPLDEVMAKYAENPHLARVKKDKKGVSPFLRAKPEKGGPSSSDGSPIKFELDSTESDCPQSSSAMKKEGKSPEASPIKKEEGGGGDCDSHQNGTEPQTSSQVNGSEVKHVNGEVSEKETDENKESDEDKCNKENEKSSTQENGEVIVNGGEEQESGKGKGKGLKSGKGKALLKNSEVQAIKEAETKEKKRVAASKAEEIYRRLQEAGSEDEMSDDDSDEEDDNFEDDAEDEDEDDESEEDEDEDGDDDEKEDDEESNEADPYTEFAMNMKEEPGFDSGCTACLALLRGSELYVANVGDSRIVVCRDGEAIDMSIDHKPEDDPESARILKAGGRVTDDGRVNGGLNLSRAIGDHGYKQNKNFPPEEQMISPSPDIQSMTLTAKDQFMIVACDGIWNSLSSQEACDFVRESLEENKKLSLVCEELFDHCLASDTLGDGTGCDNMTCIIVKFKDIHLNSSASAKRTSDEAENEELKQGDKKLKCEDK